MPVGPIDTASLDMDIHGVDADSLVTLEGLLISRMGVTGEQAADLIVISYVQDLILRAFGLAGVVCLHEVSSAAAEVTALGVVAELRAGAEAQALVDVLASGLAWHGVEARAAGTVGRVLGAHAARFIPTDAGVGGTAGQLGVDAAVLLIRAVPAVIEHVAAQRGGEAALVPAQKLLLVFAVRGLSRGGLAVLLISPISAVVGAVALAPDPQTDTIVLTTEGPVWRAHKPGALLRVLIRVVPAVVLAIALPCQGLAQGIVALELV